MVFNSFSFAIFFAAFFLLHWLAASGSARSQNALVLAGSYAFYALGDWRFLPLLVANSAVFFALGAAIDRSPSSRSRRALAHAGVALGLGQLVLFKYVAFLAQTAAQLLAPLGVAMPEPSLGLLLPLGVSFYTFRNLGYILDIRAGKAEPARDWLVFFSYVALFPCLLAGPIDRPGALLPQLEKKRLFDADAASEGLRQVAWGLFKKVVIADNCGVVVDEVFGGYRALPGSTLAFGAFLFSIQLYADFSGYSDMAIGMGRMLGLALAPNFAYPFFARNPADFWRRWHISLTSWVTHHAFGPLARRCRRLGKVGIALAVMANMTLIGLWHGANWTYLLFGFIHGCLFIPLIVRGRFAPTSPASAGAWPSASETWRMSLVVGVVTLTAVVFRSPSVADAVAYLERLFSPSLVSPPVVARRALAVFAATMAAFLLVVEWLNRDKPYPLQGLGAKWPAALRWSFYYAAAIFTFFSAGVAREFIYARF